MDTTDRAALDHRIADALGVDIDPGDTVTVTQHGGRVRLRDVGRRARVAGFTQAGNVMLFPTRPAHDAIANGRSVPPAMLIVARRDGKPGHEGNRGCDCMTEDLNDGLGERHVTHSLRCHLHPEHGIAAANARQSAFYAENDRTIPARD